MSAKSEVEAMLDAGKQSKIQVTRETGPRPSGEDTYFPKFRTIRRSTGDELDPTTTFTLLPGKDHHAAVALRAYVDSVRATMPGLANALESAFPVLADIDLDRELGIE